eukprot:m.19733 g.19733  ORF g.19733 m.19733 type:complete len:895 (+) comp27893_c1_seq1:119-2803(+)
MWREVLLHLLLAEAIAGTCPQLDAKGLGKIWRLETNTSLSAWYVCQPGYEPNRVQEIQCNKAVDNATWLPHTKHPLCQVVNCGHPLLIPRATLLKHNGLSYGSAATYRCNASYVPTIHQDIFCQYNGQWSDLQQQCRPLTSRSICSLNLDDAAATAVEYLGDEVGKQAVKLSRRQGLDQTSAFDKTFVFNLKTQSGSPLCLRELEFLGSSEVWIRIDLKSTYTVIQVRLQMAGGDQSSQNGLSVRIGDTLTSDGNKNPQCGPVYDWNTFGGKVEFNCSAVTQGRHINIHLPRPDTAMRVCTIELTVVCSCGPAPVLQNAAVTEKDGVATYTCLDGFGKMQSFKSVCGKDGEWMNVVGECKPKTGYCSDLKAPANGYLDRLDLFPGKTMKIECMPGFVRKPPNAPVNRTCNNGKWSGQDVQCVSCSPPVPLKNGSFCCSDFRVGSTVNFSCSKGFFLMGAPSARCTKEAVWDNPSPKCTPRYCGTPPVPENGNYTTTELDYYHNPSCISYVCYPGYELSGNNKSCCRHNGTWPPPPKCNTVTCGIPPSLKNGYYSGDLLTHRSCISYHCYPGYILEGESSMCCQSDATWLPTAIPKCKMGLCESPGPIDNGDVSWTCLQANCSVFYRCDIGFIPFAFHKATCIVDNGSAHWRPIHRPCERINCSSPAIPKNGGARGDDYVYQGKITYYCNDGYKVVGSPGAHCTAGGTWEPKAPVCLYHRCGHPPDVHGATFRSAPKLFYNSGDVVYYTCEFPFKLVGNGSVECGGDGNWTVHAFCYRDGEWEEWSTWSRCSQSCGKGQITRKRNCFHQTLKGKECSGSSEETKTCCLGNCTISVVNVIYKTKYSSAGFPNRYTTSCGFWNWFRCTRYSTKYKARSYPVSQVTSAIHVTEKCPEG